MDFNEQTTLREFLANDDARKVLAKHVKGALEHPRLSEGLDLTLGELAAVPETGFSPRKLAAMFKDITKLETKRAAAAAKAAKAAKAAAEAE
jgi:hypothetical protein